MVEISVNIIDVLINKYPSVPSDPVKKAIVEFLDPVDVFGIIHKVAEKSRGILPEIEIRY